MSPGFATQKTKFLQQLTAPDASDTNRSPEGSVDVGIRRLVDEINKIDTLATTSSCSGRVVVYLEGRSSSLPRSNLDDDMGISGLAITADGGSNKSLFVSHDPLPLSGKSPVAPMLGLSDHTNLGVPSSIEGVRWVRCKFESLVGDIFASCLSTDLFFRTSLHLFAKPIQHQP
jgi:tRNA wybutosine-synthesizing protein 3